MVGSFEPVYFSHDVVLSYSYILVRIPDCNNC